MSKYNGHNSWTQWNVSLWLNNDEALYNGMRHAIRWTKNRTEAARKMLAWLADSGQTETPDGAAYTITSIKQAMVGM